MQLVTVSDDDTVEDLTRRVCVAEGLEPPAATAPQVAASVRQREVTRDTPVTSLHATSVSPIVLTWPSGVAAPAVSV